MVSKGSLDRFQILGDEEETRKGELSQKRYLPDYST